MAAVLLMVGRGEEQPSIVQRLLDVERTPGKPQYNMASGEQYSVVSCRVGSSTCRSTESARCPLLLGLRQ